MEKKVFGCGAGGWRIAELCLAATLATLRCLSMQCSAPLPAPHSSCLDPPWTCRPLPAPHSSLPHSLAHCHRLMRRYPRLQSMMDYEGEAPVGGRTYDPHCVDPSEAGALAATLWELPLAAQHFHPHVAQVRANVCVHRRLLRTHWARFCSAAHVYMCLYFIGERAAQHFHPHVAQVRAFSCV